MRADELRRIWTEFFTARAHTEVPSAGLIPHHPSAPMFNNSGMMQFVPYYLGEEEVPFSPKRAVTVQKCVRAGGKHNDLDAIGRSMRHLSFFEMLGNFSFGDYFKAEAIPWSWEFLTEELGLDGDRLWVTVHISDDEAEEIWADGVGVPRDRIQRLDKDNFWEMGDIGPCGPSSELFWDFGPDLGPEGGPANPAAEERYVEIWNLVFPQYFRGADRELTDLPDPGIDTGAGLERILGVLADSPSLYAADTLSVLTDRAQEVTGKQFGNDRLADVALRLIADHTRTVAFLVSDGVMPSNEERGYVLRRVLRRAVYFSYLLGVEKPVLPPMIETCVDLMGEAYPDLAANADGVLTIVSREEERFRQTLKTGSSMLDDALEHLEPEGETRPVLDGGVAFQLHDTYGFPLEVTQEILSERGVDLDVDGFDAAMADQRARAKAAAKGGSVAVGEEVDAFRDILNTSGPTEFVGRDLDSVTTTVVGVVPSGEDDGTVSIFLQHTPFYAESGGQIGDTGVLTTDGARAEVVDTVYALPGLHRHVARVTEGSFDLGTEVTASIDTERRDSIKRHHTATHILHWALREVLGDHVKQQGSLVLPDRLRFDFSHFQALTDDEIVAIEDLANHEILANAEARHYETTMDEAREKGAVAFFGDKYGDIVRVLEAGEHSIELCGGTHVGRLGDIGPVKIIAEESVGSNLRRITAIAGTGPVERLRERERELASLAETAGVPLSDLADGVQRLRAQAKEAQDEVKALRKELSGSRAADLASQAVDGVLVARVDGVDRNDLREMAVSLRDHPDLGVVVLGGAPEGGGAALVAATTEESGVHAGDLLGDAKKLIQGGGPNDPRLVMAGGKNADGVGPALDAIRAATQG
ncbi:alanine--tRNA ligase [Actinospongicola halichondriae]|uniref:alanine--tRNA ligase n=1 Tax=Actinospongicola halichondriae TaxID=3236844 RepID=UPI003D525CB1